MRRVVALALTALASFPTAGRAQHYSVGGKVYQAYMADMSQTCDQNVSPCPPTSATIIFALDNSGTLSCWSIGVDGDTGLNPLIEWFEIDQTGTTVQLAGGTQLHATLSVPNATDLDAGLWSIRAVDYFGEVLCSGPILPDQTGDCANVVSAQCQLFVHGTMPMLANPHSSPTIIGDGLGVTTGTSFIEVFIKDSGGNPIVNLARDAIWAEDTNVSRCGTYGYTCEYPTDRNGRTVIRTVAGLGCSEQLTVYVCGNPIGTVAIPVRSADILPASPGCAAFNDLVILATHASTSSASVPCADFNGNGTIDSSDVSAWSSLATPCFDAPE